ncbi:MULTISPECIES: F0F1 ATP synthase subunit B [Pseudoalteromonas]|uniref:ATP synthase subunit b n=2 Tax=Pseudoalteromonas rubra TaxID=43658 RepID=A0A0L0EX54_9GAMM|nr:MULTISPECIES: F0F1 ATP synthase subunit B [Pseudoalteromonas]MCG7563699.1 F0F1 ATP synthase subunit B [Pseudoalteromonas sp. McH1-42]ALU43623.1 ATP F0F1 synthase subunit B [Pseudoalteromonas rubra]KNC69015.1 ATP F0F1 synthase subunit B [Pseudoalteromonas rubra]MDK1313870.1 F0F1 ATP synthase subunit B [Pseudoalteromonas sp. R96]MEC4090318.1 F0F1 ATP synthase subunit B [Pseudoalteromonas rubra]
MNLNATLIGELIAFVVFVWFCMKFVWPPLNGAIEARQKKIEDGLAASDKAEKDLEQAREKAAEELKEAKTQASEIIEQAKKRATLIVDEETTRGQQEREKIIAQGHSEIESERNRVKEELRQQVATLAVVGAEKILEREIDQAAHSDIVEKLVAEL